MSRNDWRVERLQTGGINFSMMTSWKYCSGFPYFWCQTSGIWLNFAAFLSLLYGSHPLLEASNLVSQLCCWTQGYLRGGGWGVVVVRSVFLTQFKKTLRLLKLGSFVGSGISYLHLPDLNSSSHAFASEAISPASCFWPEPSPQSTPVKGGSGNKVGSRRTALHHWSVSTGNIL